MVSAQGSVIINSGIYFILGHLDPLGDDSRVAFISGPAVLIGSGDWTAGLIEGMIRSVVWRWELVPQGSTKPYYLHPRTCCIGCKPPVKLLGV